MKKVEKPKKRPKLHKVLLDPDRQQFDFSIPFQESLLKFLLISQESTMILQDIKSSYFTLLEHSLICEALKKSFRKYKKKVGKAVVLETLQVMLNTSEYANLVQADDLPRLEVMVKDLYNGPLEDEEIVKSEVQHFIAYIELRGLSATTNFENFEQCKLFATKAAGIIRKAEGDGVQANELLSLVGGVTKRQLLRQIDPDVIPTPIRQLNELSNAGGYPSGSVVVLLDKAKARKTFALINVARGYLAMRKCVLYVDTENGASQIMGRMVQSTLNKTKKEVLSGDFDKIEKRHVAKYRRLKTEFFVQRIPALLADANYIRQIIEDIQRNHGIKVNVLMIDYAGKMASISRDKDDFERISNVYIDVQNMALELGLDAVWTAHHVVRDAGERQNTRYEESDISGAISIIRNAQCIIGLNSTEEERENNVQRLEIVVQRDGRPNGRALLNVDLDRQRWKEFTREQRKAYEEQYGPTLDSMYEPKDKKKRRPAKPTNHNADADKAQHKTGDI